MNTGIILSDMTQFWSLGEENGEKVICTFQDWREGTFVPRTTASLSKTLASTFVANVSHSMNT